MHLLHMTVRSRQNFFSGILRNTLKLTFRCKQRSTVWESMSERKVFYITYKRQYTPSDNQDLKNQETMTLSYWMSHTIVRRLY